MLLFQRAVVEGSLSLNLQCAKYSDLIQVLSGEEKEKAELLLDILTPIAKTYPSEMGILSVSQGLQCLGGYGFCEEFPLEQYYRDIRIHAIHEGTTGIQGMDLLGRKIVMKQGKAFLLYLAEVDKAIAQANTIEELARPAAALAEALEQLKKVTAHLTGLALNNQIEIFLAEATLYLEMFGIVTIAWQWLLQALAALRGLSDNLPSAEADFYRGKLHTFRYFLAYELPKIEGLARTLLNANGLALRMNEAWFED
jgi:butyryl-CoA dehydrogenase